MLTNNLNNHVTTEEIIRMVYTRNFDEDFVAFAGKINHHLYECEECLAKYNAVLEIKEMVENAGKESVNVDERKDVVLYYDRMLCRENDYVVLLDDYNEVRYAEKIRQFDDTQMCATFRDVLPNNYYAVIAPHDRNGSLMLNK